MSQIPGLKGGKRTLFHWAEMAVLACIARSNASGRASSVALSSAVWELCKCIRDQTYRSSGGTRLQKP